MGKKSLLALNSVLLMDSACQMSSLNNRRLCHFFQIFLQEVFPRNGIKWKDTFCLREVRSRYPRWMNKAVSHELQCDVHVDALFSPVVGGSHRFTSSSVISLWILTERAHMPSVSSYQSLKTNSNDNQNFWFTLLQNQTGIPTAGARRDVDFKNSAAWEWLNSVAHQPYAFCKAWESGTWHSFLPLCTTLGQSVLWCKYTICWL